MPEEQYDAIVLGAGILGLTIALELAQKGLKVTIAARDLPEDVHSTAFSSPWAGASFVPWAENAADASREERTFARMWAIAQTRPDLVAVTPFRQGWDTPGAYVKPISAAHLPDFRYLPPDECPGPFKFGVGFTSLTLNPTSYTLHVLSQLKELGVKIHRARVSSIFEAFSIPLTPSPSSIPSPSTNAGPKNPASLGSATSSSSSPSPTHLTSPLVINATGLGSLSLLGVSDPLVHPAKGQTITVRAPRVHESLGWKEPRDPSDPSLAGQSVYIIPRPGSGGLVTVGGCYLKDDWSTNVNPAVAERILREAVLLCPELKGEDGRVDVVSHNVGLRPCRVGGTRVELEMFDLEAKRREYGGVVPSSAPLAGLDGSGGKRPRGKVGVVHAYGVGGAGYQDSFGIAKDVAELVQEYRASQGLTSSQSKL